MTTHDSMPTTSYDESTTPLSTPPPRIDDQPYSGPAGAGDVRAASTQSGATPNVVTHNDATHDNAAPDDVLIGVGLSADYCARWKTAQGDFIDEPRKAVTDADALVGEVLAHVGATFAQQRKTLEQGWADDAADTEELRIALRRYRTFFDRLLTL